MYGNRRQTIVKIRYERFPKGTLVGMATTTQHVPNSSLRSMLNFNQFLFFEFREVEKLYVGQDASRLDMLVLGILNLGKRIEEVLKPTITYL